MAIEIGKTIAYGTQVHKDAIHVPVAPVVVGLGQKLYPSQIVTLIDGEAAAITNALERPVGIVDPFLPAPVLQGEKFWLFLIPGSTQNLRHEWDHEAFPEPKPEDYGDDECRGCYGQ